MPSLTIPTGSVDTNLGGDFDLSINYRLEITYAYLPIIDDIVGVSGKKLSTRPASGMLYPRKVA
jgi:hypothetical protein